MADLSKGTIRWMRKRHPVDPNSGVLDVGVRLTNIGTAPASTWESPNYVVRTHLHAADGTYLVDQERVELRGARNLLDFVAAELEQMGDTPVKVRIRASHDTPMRYLVDAARVCDELGVDKALEVRMATEG